jgi:hypothetical protein
MDLDDVEEQEGNAARIRIKKIGMPPRFEPVVSDLRRMSGEQNSSVVIHPEEHELAEASALSLFTESGFERR